MSGVAGGDGVAYATAHGVLRGLSVRGRGPQPCRCKAESGWELGTRRDFGFRPFTYLAFDHTYWGSTIFTLKAMALDGFGRASG